jgi:uncharacterized membrane protein
MKLNKKDLLIFVIPFIILAIIYPFLPARIPRQFHFNGQPTSYMAKEFIFLIGFIPYLIYLRYRQKNK